MARAVVGKPKVIYDKQSDILRIQIDERPSTQSAEVAEGVVLDYAEDGRAVAIEIDGAGLLLSEFRTAAASALSPLRRG